MPYSDGSPKGAQIEKMFDEIAEEYDLLNHTLSFGIDRRWRRIGIKSLGEVNPANILDIATGTGDMAIKAYRLLKPERIVGIDISEGMMKVAAGKVRKAELSEKILFEKQDCTDLQFDDGSFDAAMIAFGIRNFADLDKGLQEISRVLRPGGKLMILELSTPEHFPMKQAYKLYSKLVISKVGRIVSKSKAAYDYLPESVAQFPQNAMMRDILEKNGYRGAQYRKLTLGICTLYTGYK